MGRSPMSDESGVKKGPWTPEEDEKLTKYIHKHGHGSWRALPRLAGLNRCGKSCRLRWTNYLRPDIKRGKFSQDEEQSILNLHAILGNKWSAIATHLPGRTDNEIKNYWNTHLKKKLIQMGFDPMTHRPRTDVFATLPHLIALVNLIENPSSWEDRLQSEAAQMARLNQCLHNLLLQPQLSIPNNLQLNTLFNPLKDSSSLLPYLQPPPPPPAAAQFLHDSSMQFLHLPELHPPCSVDHIGKGVNMVDQDPDHFGGVMLSQGENSPASASPPWLQAEPVIQTSINNAVDVCSTSSYGGAAAAQIWSELLDDPIFNEIP